MQEVIIGSRPASRKKTTAIENLRAVPRVFSWPSVASCFWPSPERHQPRQIVLLRPVAGTVSLSIARIGV